jgi:hypothetical protein
VQLVRKVLADIGRPEYWARQNGWPPAPPLGASAADRARTAQDQQSDSRIALQALQQAQWRETVASHHILNPHYARLKHRCEFCEYCREGSIHYRLGQAMHKWRTEQIPAMVVHGRYLGHFESSCFMHVTQCELTLRARVTTAGWRATWTRTLKWQRA